MLYGIVKGMYLRTCTNNLDVILVNVRFDKFCVLDQNVFIRMYCASSENKSFEPSCLKYLMFYC